MDWEALRGDTTFCPGAEPGPIAAEIGEKIRSIPGWFTIDDCAHFALVLRMQSAFGLRGDVLEIGTYHGRSAAAMAPFLDEGERLVLCDLFGAAPREDYPTPPTPALLRSNLRAVCPALRDEQLEIHDGPSQTLSLARPIRFAHVDGGHTRGEALGDLRRVDGWLLARGVIAVDDYHHREFPEVTPAVDQFLAERRDYRVLADLNRHGAVGRKLYLHKLAPR
ncbi:MAG TPA: class I SAM-dependent methyltransferase [Polyangia bacterium]|nr:class I SAM-dependent methyltransferase [Polyangia bacterium]